jgi:hypothetical protein
MRYIAHPPGHRFLARVSTFERESAAKHAPYGKNDPTNCETEDRDRRNPQIPEHLRSAHATASLKLHSQLVATGSKPAFPADCDHASSVQRILHTSGHLRRALRSA